MDEDASIIRAVRQRASIRRPAGMNRQVVRWNLVDGAAAAVDDPEPRVADEARALKHEATGGGVVAEWWSNALNIGCVRSTATQTATAPLRCSCAWGAVSRAISLHPSPLCRQNHAHDRSPRTCPRQSALAIRYSRALLTRHHSGDRSASRAQQERLPRSRRPVAGRCPRHHRLSADNRRGSRKERAWTRYPEVDIPASRFLAPDDS